MPCVPCPPNACFFNTSTYFSCVKMWGPGNSLFHCPPPARLSLVSIDIISSVRGKFDFYKKLLGFWNISDPENRRFWIYQHPGRTARFQRRTGGYLTNSNCFCGPWGYTIKKWVFDISENCDDEPSKPPGYPAGVCGVDNTRLTMVYIASESEVFSGLSTQTSKLK